MIDAGAASDGRWVFLSDLHLGMAERRRSTGDAVTGFFESLADDCPHTTRIVLLGDAFELLGPNGSGDVGPLALLDAIAERHGSLFGALRRCLDRGISIDVVLGNHDLDLVRPVVADRLRDHLGLGRDDARLKLFPWIYVVPGLVFAEHGSQHHDLNRIPRLLDPFQKRSPSELRTPPLAVRERLGQNRRLKTPITVAANVGSSVAATWWGERAASGPDYQSRVAALASELGLPPGLVSELDRVSRFRPAATTRRLARRYASYATTPVAADEYLLATTREVAAACARWGTPFPLYLFGHTHRARDLELGDTDGPVRYLNCGTWTAFLHGDDPTRDDLTHYPYVEVVRRGGDITAGIRSWHYDPLVVESVS